MEVGKRGIIENKYGKIIYMYENVIMKHIIVYVICAFKKLKKARQ